MKKRALIFLGILLFLTGCEKEVEVIEEEVMKYEKRENDVYSYHGVLEKKYLFEKFLEDVKNEKDAEVRIVNMTIEGDPIIWDIKYNNGKFIGVYNNSYDRYGYRVIEDFHCDEFIESETKKNEEKEKNYSFRGCEGHGQDIYIFTEIENGEN